MFVMLLLSLIAWNILDTRVAIAEAQKETLENQVIKLKEERVIVQLKLIDEESKKFCSLDVVECEGEKPVGETKEDVQRLITYYAEQYEIDPALPLRIAYAESGYNAKAKNPRSTAKGVFQWINSSFKANCTGDPLNADDNIECGVRMVAEGRMHHWDSSKQAWNY